MADYHFVYKDVEGASTQWDDIQRKLGNLPPKPPPFKPPPFTPSEAHQDSKTEAITSWIDQRTEDQLEDLEDDPHLDDDRFLQDYRKKRLAEMREVAKVRRSVIPISGSDFVREVSQASEDVWVVVILYKDGYPECGLLLQCLEALATKYPGTKFVKIMSTDCIPNYPDRVALVLCQSNPVLIDGQSGSKQSRKAVLDDIRQRLIEKVVRDHEDDDGGSSSD
ncbi:hypothetical protein RHMOL_Rhmol08G0299200 [Rhododendron molle]|uniref:Uncharacterized protein n=1 Tax=Rhododendron molle TaxID=49168 RepID=A0ACC0MVZ4_RHOML|nr:hypothetical protein RHMOL_Rhmol08G0299200 [Rhododendron molle]